MRAQIHWCFRSVSSLPVSVSVQHGVLFQKAHERIHVWSTASAYKFFSAPWLCKLICAERSMLLLSSISVKSTRKIHASLIDTLQNSASSKAAQIICNMQYINYGVLHGLLTTARCRTQVTWAIAQIASAHSRNPQFSDWNCCLAKERGKAQRAEGGLGDTGIIKWYRNFTTVLR